MNRREVASKFSKYIQTEGNASMEQICKSGSSEFQLQVQQQFLKDWMKQNKAFKYLMLYHDIGSGKTCTSITMAEQYLKTHKNGSVLVILPARLRTNFYDELVSSCSTLTKDQVNERYQVWSFERFRKEALSQPDIRAWAREFTKEKFVIFDEVHNMLAYTYKKTHFEHMLETGTLIKTEIPKGIYPMLLKTFAWNAHASAKFLLLSATPVYDNITQFYELASLINDGDVPAGSLEDMIELFRGKISYFPGTSKRAYPKVEYTVEVLKPSKRHQELFGMLESGEEKDSFMTRSRQLGIVYMPKPDPFKVTKAKLAHILDKKLLKEHSPKVAKMIDYIKKLPGKHLCYCSFVKLGIDFISQVLEKQLGFVNYKDVLSGKKDHKDFKVYACWDGRSADGYKQLVKSRVNNKDNLDGKMIRVVLGSPAMKEGVSIKHVQHMHILDPVWNQSGQNQIEGRAVRFCSHVDIPAKDPVLKRQVNIHLYQLTSEESVTSDMEMYMQIIPKKYKLVQQAENALKKVAIDYHLFKGLYTTSSSPVFKGKGKSPIAVQSDLHITKKSRYQKVLNTCPKSRRSPCKPDFEERKNKHGDLCCFKRKSEKKRDTCPSKRRPVNDKCIESMELKKNKHGDDCCYKRRA
jgi:hypothetical protein